MTLGSEHNYKETAPYHSYIAVAPDFKDPKALADHLLYLDQNDEKYAEYFWWKEFYVNTVNTFERGQSFCDLCEALHMENLPREHITKLKEWWVDQAQCKNVLKS